MTMTTSEKWDRRFIELAEFIAQWSKDPSTQVGAVIVRPDKTIASVGYNGFPRGTDDSEHLYEDKEMKYARVVHAEINAIISAQNADFKGCTVYVSPLYPCPQCTAALIQAGITRVVARLSNRPDWMSRFKTSKQLMKEAGVEFVVMEL
jgi:dCMP deaminase